MPLMNATPLKEARIEKWAPEYGRGEGFQIYQIIMGVAAFAVTALTLWIPFTWFGVGMALFAGYAVAIAPNLIDTHHQHPRKYLEGLVKKRLNHSLLLNDKRVPDPKDERERYIVEISEFQPYNPN